jgi:hypothetical protein
LGIAASCGEGQVYSGEWRERVEKLYGAEPVITWFDSPVIVDNQMGGKITSDAAG